MLARVGQRGLLIGEVASRSGVSRKALRLYEARGILPPAQRTPTGYRIYPSEVLGVLAFVADGRRLGLTLAEIRRVVALRRGGSVPCAHVRRLLEGKAADLEVLLKAVRHILRTWRAVKVTGAAVCPHLEARGR